jgi:hypothetical protein
MADKASLQLIGLVLASVTASIIFIATVLVYSWANGRLGDYQATERIERIAVSHRA